MVKDWRGEANWRGVRDVLLDIDGDFRAVAMEEVRRSGVRMAVYFMMLCWWILDNCGCYMDRASKSHRFSLMSRPKSTFHVDQGSLIENRVTETTFFLLNDNDSIICPLNFGSL